MVNYIDGFVFPLRRDRLDEYRRLVEPVADIWKEHGAISYREFIGDDLTLAGTRSFADAAAAGDEEVVVFGWVEFESRSARDTANEKVASDPRMVELMDASDSGFDATRMAYGGFRPLIQ
ncbi:MAG: DUF1428 family protein [Woeseiaceae bacterium]|nr:DUF1428 family protein [Woeseiaceae bacterium]